MDEGVTGGGEDEEGAETPQEHEFEEVEERKWEQAHEPHPGGRGVRMASS